MYFSCMEYWTRYNNTKKIEVVEKQEQQQLAGSSAAAALLIIKAKKGYINKKYKRKYVCGEKGDKKVDIRNGVEY